MSPYHITFHFLTCIVQSNNIYYSKSFWVRGFPKKPVDPVISKEPFKLFFPIFSNIYK